MIYIAAIFAALFFYTIWGRPPELPPEEDAAPTWRCVLKNKQEIMVPALTEADAMRALLKQKIDPTRIVTLERVS